jgi:hypothetical protein
VSEIEEKFVQQEEKAIEFTYLTQAEAGTFLNSGQKNFLSHRQLFFEEKTKQ